MAAALGVSFSVSAGEVLSTPDEAAVDKWAVVALYGTAKLKPEVHLTGTSAIQVPLSGGGSTTIFSNENADVGLEQHEQLAGVAVVVRPRKLRYTVSLAQIRNFELRFASGSVTNSLRTDNGYRVGFGIAGSFVPVTVASMGIGWSLDYRYLRASLDRFESDGAVSGADQIFEQDEFQGAATASWRWQTFQPYGGLKIDRWVTRMTDRGTHNSIRGTKDGVGPVAGLEWMPQPGEGLKVEGSLGSDRSVTAAWTVDI